MLGRLAFLWVLLLAVDGPHAKAPAAGPAGPGIGVSRISVFGSSLFATGYSGVWRSQDRGESWQCVAPGQPSTPPVLLGNRFFALTGLGSRTLRLISSSDGGASWDTLPALDKSDSYHYLSGQTLDSFDGNLLLGGTDDFRSPDSGRTWYDWYIGSAAWAHLGGSLLVFTEKGILRYRQGGGFDHPDTVHPSLAEPPSTHMSNPPGEGKPYGRFLFSDIEGLYRSSDSGATWTRVLYPFSACTELCPNLIWEFAFGAGGGYAIANSTLYRSSDSGSTWTNIGAADDSWDLTPLGGDTLLAISSGSILRSLDGGAHFEPTLASVALRPPSGPADGQAFRPRRAVLSGWNVIFVMPATKGTRWEPRDLSGKSAPSPGSEPSQR